MIMRHIPQFLMLLLFLTGCGREEQTRVPEGPLTTVPNAPTLEQREEWQRPEELVSMVITSVKGNTIADLFAGDGYFTFTLIDAGLNVIALDPDPENIARLEELKRQRGLGDDRLIIRQAQANDPGLRPGEADAAILVHRFTTIADRSGYMSSLREGLRPPRSLFVIDWQYRETPLGPPLEQRMRTEEIMDELGRHGYNEVGAHAAKMPFQVIYFASDPVEMDEEEYQRMMDQIRVRPQE
jgi:hypothetical protein